MKMNASGEFSVQIIPQKDDREIPLFGRMTNDKVFSGDFVGTSQGQMLSVGTSIPNSAAYVSLERVEGELFGETGTFVLAHSGIMDRGEGTLTVNIVPDSGTEELVGITGTMTIDVVEGKHLYTIEYELPE